MKVKPGAETSSYLIHKLDLLDREIIERLTVDQDPPFDLIDNRHRLINIISSLKLTTSQVLNLQRSHESIFNKLQTTQRHISKNIKNNHKNLNLIKRYNRASID